MATTSSSSDDNNNTNNSVSIESLLGSKLLVKAKSPAKPTKTLMKNKELIGLYFSASWCPPCKVFSPLLSEFYKAAAKENNLEIVYISSDKTVESFEEYYAKMPWLSIPLEEGSAAVKNNLAQTLGIQGIPTLVVIDAKTGEFVTANARMDVEKVGGDATQAKAVIDQWKSMERKPVSEAAAEISSGTQSPFMKFLMFWAKNPIYIFGLFYFYNWLQKRMKEWYGDPDAPPAVEDEDTTGQDDAEF